MNGSTLAKTGPATALTAAAGSLATDPDSAWYRSLDKPAWQPPPAAFPAVWTPIYASIAFAAARALDASTSAAERSRFRRTSKWTAGSGRARHRVWFPA